MVVRIFAVVLLLSGLAAGIVIGIQEQPSESLSLKSASEAETEDADNVSATPPPDTNAPQPRPPGAELKLAREENELSKQAQAEAEATAKKINESIAQRADAAAKATQERIESALENALPPTPADCLKYSGNKQIGCSVLAQYSFGNAAEMSCLEKLWDKESKWNHKARNKSSGAYGIAQALPGKKMASEGADWETNPATQIKWGLGYIKGRYKTPCNAWGHSQRTGWY